MDSQEMDEAVRALTAQVAAEVPELQDVNLRAGVLGNVTLRMLRVRKGERGHGHASRALDMITKWADQHGVVLTLTPDPAPLDGERPISKERLTRWYARHGWRRNRGRYARLEFSEAMYRLPVKP